MSDVKMNGAGLQPVKLVADTPSSQKTQGNVVASTSSVEKAEDVKQNVDHGQVGQEQVKQAVTKLNDYVQSVQRDLQFNLDDESGKTIITVVDKKTSEVVRQIPDDVALKLAQDLHQNEPLSLFNAKV